MKTVMWFGFVLVAVSTGKVIFTKVGQKVIIECGVNRFTNQLEWSRENQQILRVNGKTGLNSRGSTQISGAERSRVRQNTNLEISSVREEETGRFTCKADGTVKEHTLLVVSASVVPSGVLQVGKEATLDCRVKHPTLSVTVEWKKPDGIPHPDSPTVHLKPVADSDAGTWTYTVTYGQETFSETLKIKVSGPVPVATAPNNPESSKEKDIRKPAGRNNTTNGKSSDAEPLLLGLDWWVWLAIGVGCLIVILLTVFVIILCKRTRERKKRFQRMKSTEQPLKPKKYCQCDRQAAAAKPQQGRRREKPSALPLQAC